MNVEIRALQPDDERNSFRSGDPSLDLFFHRYAGQNQFRHHIGVTYVALERSTILGFATVAPGSLEAEQIPAGRKLPPYPMPILRVARLAVDERAQGRGLGGQLLRFCLELAEKMKVEVGCVGILVDAKPMAIEFYKQFGFQALEVAQGLSSERPTPTVMFLSLGTLPKLPKKI